MGSKLKKIALPIAAIGLMAATGGAAAPAITGAASSAGATAAAAQAAAAKAAAAKLAAGQSMHPLIAAGSALGKKTAITAAMNPLTVAGINAAGAGAAAPTGLMGLLSKAGTFAKAGLMNPLSAKGAATYGGLGTLAGMMTEDKQKELDTSKDDDAAQAAYDYHMMMSKGIMSPEDARRAFASYGKGMKGDYTPGTEMGAGRYEELYPQLNYTGLNRYNPNPNPGPLPDKKKLREYNPYVMAAEGGRIGFDMGGSASFKDVIEQFAESLSPDEFDEFIEMNRDDQIRIMTNAGVLRDDYAAGGSIPQTETIPQGMQLEGRGGGFIPMGAKEKHDDVPAMLAKNEFVMTSDAVKAAGGGSVNKGAQVMYDLMNSLESKV